MKPVHKFIIEPKGNRYNNTTKNGVILNSIVDIDDAVYTNRIGIIKEVPKRNTELQIGDEVIVHTNVFRKFWNIHRKLTNGGSFIKEGVYGCYEDQIFAYKRDGVWKGVFNACFVKPYKLSTGKVILDLDPEKDAIGELVASNNYLESQGFNVGDSVGFIKGSEFKFKIDGEVWYKMNNSSIVYKYDKERINTTSDKVGVEVS